MNRCLKRTIFILLVSIAAIFTLKVTLAQTCDTDCSPTDIGCVNNRIKDCQGRISTLQSQANTLSNQIKQFNAQIYLTALKVRQTEERIALLGSRIDQLEVSLNDLTHAFSSRVIETYKMFRVENEFLFLISANDLSDTVSRFHYLKKIQESDRSLLEKLQAAQTTYKTEKTSQEELQSQLEVQKVTLNSQKAAKARLLTDTKNSESRYQQLLAEARAEYEAIQAIIAGKGTEIQIGHVNEGQRVANIARWSNWKAGLGSNTCNSSAAHVHFIVRNLDGVAENPFSYLQRGVSYNDCSGSSCGSSDGDSFNPSGSWPWPISSEIIFTQGYGYTWAVRNTWVSRIYSSHNGIDINSNSSNEVKAVKAGVLYQGSYNVGCLLKYVRVQHDDMGLDTLYLHIDY